MNFNKREMHFGLQYEIIKHFVYPRSYAFITYKKNVISNLDPFIAINLFGSF